MIPLYPAAKRVDNCNFARSTLWEGAIEEGHSFAFNSRSARGQQFIAEGVDLNMIPSDDYRFLLSSNMLEHTTNPLAALVEWKRLLEAGGGLILVLPHRDGTFDHRRPITTLDHLVLDFENSTPETNLDHLPEILALHDLARDPGAVDEATFRERAQRNGTVRGLHHHVFDTRLAMEVVSWAGFDLLAAEPLKPCQIVVVAQKPYGQASRTTLTASDVAEVLQKSPFASDRK
jgi:SAM-dependent methyltransferase